MYLFVSEYNYSENTDAFSLTGQYLETSKQLFPKLSGLKAENIEKIVIYSCSNAYTDENITEAECQSIETNDNYIKITYGQKSPSDVTCGKVKSNLYHLLLQNGTLKNTRFTPYLTLIEGQNDYTKITSGKLDSNFTAHSEKIEKLKLNNDWNGIINYLSGLEGAVKTELWSTPSLLSELAYALSQSIFKSKNPQKEDIEYFYRVSDECMRLDGNNYSIKSVRAYFHYNSYLKSRKESDYAEARRYYTELIEKSPGKYKEFIDIRKKAEGWKLAE